MEVILVAPPRPPPRARREARARPAAGLAKAPIPEPARLAPSASAGLDWRVKPESAGPQEPTRRALRGLVGCRAQDVLALTPEERDACADRLAAGAREARAYPVVSPRLKKQFDGVYECPKGDVWCEYRMGKGPYPGLFAPHGRKKTYREWD